MNNHDATEQAYRNGYEAGQKDAVKHSTYEGDLHIVPLNCSTCRNCGELTPMLVYCGWCGTKMDL